jgi:hypothetical protein
MKALLIATATLGVAAGTALIAVPARVASLLLGSALDSPGGAVLARVGGAALLSLGIVCSLGSRDARSRAAFGIVAAMLLYNLAAVALFLSARYGAGMTGMGLLPASALHAAMALWCLACLREAWARGSSRE